LVLVILICRRRHVNEHLIGDAPRERSFIESFVIDEGTVFGPDLQLIASLFRLSALVLDNNGAIRHPLSVVARINKGVETRQINCVKDFLEELGGRCAVFFLICKEI